MPKILIAESLDTKTLNDLTKDKTDFVFDYKPDITPVDIENALCDYEGLIVRPKEVTGKAIRSAPGLKLIVRGGAGLNSIDLETAKECGVSVKNTPGENSISTAEFTFEMIMRLCAKREMMKASEDARSGNPMDPEKYCGRELAGQKIAIIGMGYIGQALAKRAAAFDMNVIYHSRGKKDVPYQYFDNLHDLLKQEAEIISLHAPLTSETNKFISKQEFELMGHGTVLINCARPQLVDHIAFGQALRSGLIESAGIDGDMDLIEPFLAEDSDNKCIITHHIADSTLQAQEKITRAVIASVFNFF